jgi:uncharacterized protein YegP (UPF0339 family)
LEQYAATLTAEHQVSDRLQRGRLLLPRFEENGRQLISAYCTLAEAVFQRHEISPVAEWLVDNFHIVEQQLRQICEDLPKSYYSQLHKLSAGEMRGYPRICSIALAFIAHTDSRFDGDSLQRFIQAAKLEFRWRFKANNGTILAESAEGYDNPANYEHAIILIKQQVANAQISNDFKSDQIQNEVRT